MKTIYIGQSYNGDGKGKEEDIYFDYEGIKNDKVFINIISGCLFVCPGYKIYFDPFEKKFKVNSYETLEKVIELIETLSKNNDAKLRTHDTTGLNELSETLRRKVEFVQDLIAAQRLFD